MCKAIKYYDAEIEFVLKEKNSENQNKSKEEIIKINF